MLLLPLLSGLCASLERVHVQLIKTTFNHCRDVKTAGGTLVNLDATSAVISKMSIVSRVKGSLALLESVDSVVLVKECAFTGLASSFGHFSSGSVAVRSSSFVDSARPLTIEGLIGAGSLGGSGQHANLLECQRTYAGWSAMKLANKEFVGCTGDTNSADAGGAVYYERHEDSGTDWTPVLTITDCTFKSCTATNRWGDAIYSSADMSSFVCDGCTFESFQGSSSVAHFQCGKTNGNFGNLTLRDNKFKAINVVGKQGGGSGLTILYPTKLDLVGCDFEDCTISTNGGALMFEKGTDFVFNDCTFKQTKANKTNKILFIYSTSLIRQTL